MLISCATLAESWPSEARRSLCSSFFCAALSCWVRSSTLVSRFWVNWLISPSAVRRRSRMTSKERASSSSSSLLPTMSMRLVELHVADGLGAFDQLLDGPAEEAAGEVDDEEADQGDLDAGDEQDAVLHAGDFVVHAVEVELEVEHAEHLHAGGMGVACRLAAGGLVVDAA